MYLLNEFNPFFTQEWVVVEKIYSLRIEITVKIKWENMSYCHSWYCHPQTYKYIKLLELSSDY